MAHKSTPCGSMPRESSLSPGNLRSSIQQSSVHGFVSESRGTASRPLDLFIGEKKRRSDAVTRCECQGYTRGKGALHMSREQCNGPRKSRGTSQAIMRIANCASRHVYATADLLRVNSIPDMRAATTHHLSSTLFMRWYSHRRPLRCQYGVQA